MPASWFVSELSCQRVDVSASWFVSELSCQRLDCQRVDVSASWCVSELVCQRLDCQRVDVSASWFVSEMSVSHMWLRIHICVIYSSLDQRGVVRNQNSKAVSWRKTTSSDTTNIFINCDCNCDNISNTPMYITHGLLFEQKVRLRCFIHRLIAPMHQTCITIMQVWCIGE